MTTTANATTPANATTNTTVASPRRDGHRVRGAPHWPASYRRRRSRAGGRRD
ncbi:hypothetical protein [Nocardioides sp. B-3]|uniref:hypothetical protein n=1 Tax=Nocardioides sp. B-3 TaxID=2895565 RepID=UPI002152AB7D|nr:hypothetical protein [Nocardioides sp. B-3]UUZ61037.1 hypothetical protein LP418_10445 [Nocardioides sp. B-3]